MLTLKVWQWNKKTHPWLKLDLELQFPALCVDLDPGVDLPDLGFRIRGRIRVVLEDDLVVAVVVVVRTAVDGPIVRHGEPQRLVRKCSFHLNERGLTSNQKNPQGIISFLTAARLFLDYFAVFSFFSIFSSIIRILLFVEIR